MSEKIKIMSVSLANKIAAGEVVERPASVVKELIENAIDADATRAIVVLKQSGKQLIQIIDNGLGMSEKDLVLAFERHATSKITQVSDLEKIQTLGFRGEALPSIASVSQIEIASKEANANIGTLLYLEAGKIDKKRKKACPVGTNISIKNLFFNTPGRRNFLKADSTELQQIVQVLKRFFLAFPEIDFEVIHDDNQLFHLKSGTIEDRIKDVFGTDVFGALIPVNESLGGIELAGFVSRPDKARRSRGNQYLFLNGRPIQDKSLNHAIYQSYRQMIEPGTYPPFCLFLEMNPKLVDINVHPAKMEVRFSNDRSLYFFFLSSLKKVFNDVQIIPKFGSEKSDAFLARFNQDIDTIDIAREITDRRKMMSKASGNQISLAYFHSEDKSAESESLPESNVAQNDVSVQFWQIHNRYILSQIKSGLVVIDQHIAHERVLYERILKVLRQGNQAAGQHLLFPQTISLPMDDFLVFKEILHLLERIGFVIKVFSGTTIVIEALPIDVKIGREGQILHDIIDYYKENQGKDFDPFEKMAAAFSCKNAIKSGDVLNSTQMHAIIDQLFACDEPYFCPHGRPVIVTIDLEELDRKFKRIK